MNAHCDKCDTPFTEGEGNSAVTVIEGIPSRQICHWCHTFKHELMEDPNLEKSCGFCGNVEDDGYSGV